MTKISVGIFVRGGREKKETPVVWGEYKQFQITFEAHNVMFCLTLCQQEAPIQLHAYFKICSVVEPKCTILHRRVITVKPLRCIMAVHNNSCRVFQLPIKPWPRTHIIIWCNKAKTTKFYFRSVPALFPLIIQPCMGHKRHKAPRTAKRVCTDRV